MKKIISLLVCAAMLTMLAPLGAMAASNIVTYTEDFTSENLVNENGEVKTNRQDDAVSKMTVVNIDNEGLTLTGNANVAGNVFKIEKTANTAIQNVRVVPSVAGLCNAKNYTLEFDFVPVGFSKSGQISLELGAKYTLQANNAGTVISKIKIGDSDTANMPSAAQTSMSEKGTVKLTVKDRELVDLYVNGVSVAADTPTTVSFDSLLIQLNKSTTGTLYLDNFKLTLHDDYLLSADHDGEKFNVNYYVKGAANLYKASYDGEGMLQGVSVEPLTASATETITVQPISAAAGISSMRFFIWDNNLVPLVNSASAAE